MPPVYPTFAAGTRVISLRVLAQDVQQYRAKSTSGTAARHSPSPDGSCSTRPGPYRAASCTTTRTMPMRCTCASFAARPQSGMRRGRGADVPGPRDSRAISLPHNLGGVYLAAGPNQRCGHLPVSRNGPAGAGRSANIHSQLGIAQRAWDSSTRQRIALPRQRTLDPNRCTLQPRRRPAAPQGRLPEALPCSKKQSGSLRATHGRHNGLEFAADRGGPGTGAWHLPGSGAATRPTRQGDEPCRRALRDMNHEENAPGSSKPFVSRQELAWWRFFQPGTHL